MFSIATEKKTSILFGVRYDNWLLLYKGTYYHCTVYLRRLFKSETGSSIVHYLTDLRMEKAANLLETGDYKVFEVAEKVGYNTSQYFSKVFRNHMGKSPMDYISGV